jgi:hypothetical protein
MNSEMASLAARARSTVDTHGPELMKHPSVLGVGVGWRPVEGSRQDHLCFVIQTDSVESTRALRDDLPESFDGFSTSYEVVRSVAASKNRVGSLHIRRARLSRWLVGVELGVVRAARLMWSRLRNRPCVRKPTLIASTK